MCREDEFLINEKRKQDTLLLSPLLYGPFLISPRRNQNATPRISTPKQPCPDIKSEITQNRSALAPELPQAPLRGEVPPRLPPFQPSFSISLSRKKQEENSKNRELPAGLPASRFRIFLLIEYPYTTLSSRAGRRLSTHAHLSEFSLSSQILQSTGTPPHLSGPISCVSHSYPCGLICAAIGSCLLAGLAETSAGCQQIAESRVLQTALPCSSRFT
jgi:hypothetical protein